MTKINQLQCPACGANEVSQVSGENYRCNYCHSTFQVKNDDPFADFIKSAGAHSSGSHSSSTTTTFTTTLSAKPASRKKGALVFSLALSLAAIGGAVLMLRSSGEAREKANAAKADWKSPSIDNYNCFAGSRGAVVWLELTQKKGTGDSVRYSLRLIDPATGKKIGEQLLSAAISTNGQLKWSDELDDNYNVCRDTAYNVSDKGGIQAFDLYSGRRLFGSEHFTERFPALKGGIAKAERDYRRQALRILSASGNEYIYYFESGLLVPGDEDKRRHSNDGEMVQGIFISKGRKPQLYACTMQRDRPDDHYLAEYDLGNWRGMSGRIKSLQPLGDTVYAHALPLAAYKQGLLFFYASDFTGNAYGILQLVDARGRTVWKNSEPGFKALLDGNKSNELLISYALAGDLLVLNNTGATPQSIGVDLNTGKTKFIYEQ